MLHIDETGIPNGEENRERVCGCSCGDGCGCGRGDVVCGGGYVCSCFVEAMLCETSRNKRKVHQGMDDQFAIICASMQGIKKGMVTVGGWLDIYTSHHCIGLIWMGHYNESH